ncbi:MAG: EAL domain-containing protein [Pseudomonadota bacterium]
MTLDDISDALASNELQFFYQPKVSMLTGKIVGAEALIRWVKKDGEIISPNSFIPLAESTGFINTITLSMFQKLIIDLNILEDSNIPILVSFNASAIDFQNDKFVEAVRSALDSNLIKNNMLEIEITETVLLNDNNQVRSNINKLHSMGIALAMDDYGAGFSNIESLSKWPFSTIKLDQCLVKNLDESDKGMTIIQSSIQMAHKLEMEIVAEGIETESTYQTLQQSGCTQAQGYWTPCVRIVVASNFLEEKYNESKIYSII